jgi:hypothetical protein
MGSSGSGNRWVKVLKSDMLDAEGPELGVRLGGDPMLPSSRLGVECVRVGVVGGKP